MRTSPRPNMTAPSAFCLHAAHEAVRDGRLTDSAVREAGVILGSCVGGAASIDHYYTGLLQGRTEEQDVLKMSASRHCGEHCLRARRERRNGEHRQRLRGWYDEHFVCVRPHPPRLRRNFFFAGGTDAFSSLAYAGFNALHALGRPLLSAEPQQRHLPRRGRRCSGRGGV